MAHTFKVNDHAFAVLESDEGYSTAEAVITAIEQRKDRRGRSMGTFYRFCGVDCTVGGKGEWETRVPKDAKLESIGRFFPTLKEAVANELNCICFPVLSVKVRSAEETIAQAREQVSRASMLLHLLDAESRQEKAEVK